MITELSEDLAEFSYVSTGHLPSPDRVKKLVAEAYERFKANREGSNSDVYPALVRRLYGRPQVLRLSATSRSLLRP